MKKNILRFLLLAVLTFISVTIFISFRISSDIDTSGNSPDEVKAIYLAKAGAMKMLAELAMDTNLYDSLAERWNSSKELKIGDDKVLYKAHDETSRINLNGERISKEQLVSLGFSDETATNIIHYLKRKKGKGLEYAEELFLIKGVTPDILSGLKDSITIYGNADSSVNINTADKKVLEAITGRSDLAEEILSFRMGADQKERTEDDTIFKSITDISQIKGIDPSFFKVRSDIFRIYTEAFLSGETNITKSVEAVADRRRGKFLQWKIIP